MGCLILIAKWKIKKSESMIVISRLQSLISGDNDTMMMKNDNSNDQSI